MNVNIDECCLLFHKRKRTDFKQNSEEINALTYSIADKYCAWSQTVLHFCLT